MTFLDETFKEAIQIVGMCNLAPSHTKLPRGKQFEGQGELVNVFPRSFATFHQ